jgi:hypothetical protein
LLYLCQPVCEVCERFEEIPMADNMPLTLTVPEAGKKYFGLARDAAYRAAQRGDIPTIRVGRLLRVPVRAMEQLLDTAGQRRDGTKAA